MRGVDTGYVSLVVVLLPLGFWVWALVDFSRTDERDMRLFTRPVSLLWLTIRSVLGALMWFVAGRPDGRSL